MQCFLNENRVKHLGAGGGGVMRLKQNVLTRSRDVRLQKPCFSMKMINLPTLELKAKKPIWLCNTRIESVLQIGTCFGQSMNQ